MDHSEHTGGVFGGGVSGDEASLASGIVNEPDGINILKNLREVLEDEGRGHCLHLGDLLFADPEGGEVLLRDHCCEAHRLPEPLREDDEAHTGWHLLLRLERGIRVDEGRGSVADFEVELTRGSAEEEGLEEEENA